MYGKDCRNNKESSAGEKKGNGSSCFASLNTTEAVAAQLEPSVHSLLLCVVKARGLFVSNLLNPRRVQDINGVSISQFKNLNN